MKSVTYFLSPCGYRAFAFQGPGSVILVAAYPCSGSYNIESLHCYDEPEPNWSPCSQNEFERIKALVLANLGLIDQEALHFAQIATHEEEEANRYAIAIDADYWIGQHENGNLLPF